MLLLLNATLRDRVVFGKLTRPRIVKKSPAFCVTFRTITLLTVSWHFLILSQLNTDIAVPSLFLLPKIILSYLRQPDGPQGSSNPGRGKTFFLFSKTSRMSVRPTQPPTEQIPHFYLGKDRRGVILTSHFLLPPGWRIIGAVPPLPL